MQRVELLAVPGLPMIKAGDDLARLIGERLTGDLALRKATSWCWRRRSCPRPRAASSISRRDAVGARDRAGGRGAEGSAAGRADPVGIGEGGAQPAQRADRRASLGFVMANAGIDQSNVAPQDGVERALLLPKDPDASAEALRAKLGATALLIIDSFGRPWRRGTTGVAIGAAGLPAMLDLRGDPTCSAVSCR
jgi:Uncharacterized conserved protein